MKRNVVIRKIQMLLLLVLIGQVTWAQSKKQQIATLSATLDSLKAEQSSLQSKVETLNANIEQLTNEKRLMNLCMRFKRWYESKKQLSQLSHLLSVTNKKNR